MGKFSCWAIEYPIVTIVLYKLGLDRVKCCRWTFTCWPFACNQTLVQKAQMSVNNFKFKSKYIENRSRLIYCWPQWGGTDGGRAFPKCSMTDFLNGLPLLFARPSLAFFLCVLHKFIKQINVYDVFAWHWRCRRIIFFSRAACWLVKCSRKRRLRLQMKRVNDCEKFACGIHLIRNWLIRDFPNTIFNYKFLRWLLVWRAGDGYMHYRWRTPPFGHAM